MHKRLHTCWQAVLEQRGSAEALVDAESGEALSFLEVDARAEQWLSMQSVFSRSSGAVWCVAVNDRMHWIEVFLAALKVGAVLLPVEAGKSDLIRQKAVAQGACLLIEDQGVEVLEGGHLRDGYLLIKLSSGTTGRPKALPFSELEMMADGAQIMETMWIEASDRNFVVIPLGHSYGLGNLVMPFFMQGVGLVFGSSPYPQVIFAELQRHPCTVLPLVPPLIKALSQVDSGADGLSGVRLVVSAGAALKVGYAQRFFEATGVRVHNFYGSSETGGICFDREGRAEGDVGRTLAGVELLVDEDGRIVVQSASVCHALHPEGKAVLHDFGFVDARGSLRLTGRDSDLVKIGGRRLSLAEIERALTSLEEVSEAYLSVRPGRSGELRLVALYVGKVSERVVRTALAERIPDWQVPKFLRSVDAIRYTERGKKDRAAMEAIIDQMNLG